MDKTSVQQVAQTLADFFSFFSLKLNRTKLKTIVHFSKILCAIIIGDEEFAPVAGNK